MEDILEVNEVRKEDAIITLRRLGNSETMFCYLLLLMVLLRYEDYCPVNGFVGWGVGGPSEQLPLRLSMMV